MSVHYDNGQVIDERYEVLVALGQGGMNETFMARDRESGQIVVLKIPHASLIGDPATFSRYQREIDIGKLLDHPNIQRLVAKGAPGPGVAPYIVLEYVEGQILRQRLAEHGPLSTDETLHIARQLADALQYCHERGIVHRDLKPENVLINAGGNVKLMDFGIALLRGARRLTFSRLTSGVGTPDYMAPEQVRGERGDARTDVYALGVMMYEMLAGDVPYPGENPLAVMSQRVTKDPPLLRSARADVPPQLEAIVFHALRRDPAERYQSMAALHHDLDNLADVEIPDYAVYHLPAQSYGRLPTPLATAGIIIVVFLLLIALGVIAEMIHRGLPVR